MKESIGDPEHIVAAISYYRAMFDPARQVPELADEQAAALCRRRSRRSTSTGATTAACCSRSIGSPLDFLAEGSEMEIVDGTGHFLHVEQPDVVNRAHPGIPDQP